MSCPAFGGDQMTHGGQKGFGMTKHGRSGHATRSPRFRFCRSSRPRRTIARTALASRTRNSLSKSYSIPGSQHEPDELSLDALQVEVDTVNESVARIEAIIGRRVKRDISQMTEWARGNLARAAEAIMNTPNAHVGIVTGFYIQHAEPPSPETDGLGGMAHLAAGLANAGIPVTVITDAPCAKAVWAVVDALPAPVNLEVVSTTESSVLRLREYLEAGDRPITHLIAIERVSPGSDGRPHREHGWDMSRETAPLHLLFSAPAAKRRWYTIGIGAGGNEIGMGSLPKEIIESGIPNGEVIAATTPVDSLIVAGVSNWGAYGLLAAMACTQPALRGALLRYFNRDMDHRFLSAAVETGQAVDDSRVDNPGRPLMSVDRIPWEQHAALLEEISAVVASQPS